MALPQYANKEPPFGPDGLTTSNYLWIGWRNTHMIP
jgi:hypothetical protein